MATKYNSDSIVVIRDDRERIRQSPNMYIPNRGKEGAIHCFFEIIDNSIDELCIPDSVGSLLEVTFDKKTRELTVKDDGRGIPQEKLYDVLTVLAASGKFNNGENSAYAASGGAFGHGSTVVLVLSKKFTCTSTRGGKVIGYDFVDGLKTNDIKDKAKGHGTYTKFTLDTAYIDTSDVTVKDITERLEEKSYVFPELNISFTVLDNGKIVKKHKYGGKTIADRVKQMKLATDLFEIHKKQPVTFLKNITDDTLTKENIKIDLAFGFSEEILDNGNEDYTISYANTIKTYAGGAHVDGVRLGIQKYFRDYVLPKLKGRDKDLPIMPADMIAGLGMFVQVTLSTPEFRGQEKTQLSNQEVKFAVRDAVYDTLCEEKPSAINQMVEFVKRVSRGRLASKKTRKKDIDNAFSKDKIDKYNPIIKNLSTVDPELLLVEGDSASDNASAARDSHNQAVYPIRRPKNVFDVETSRVSQIKSTFNDVLDICGIEPGKKCDPEKSVMNRILAMTDGDVDGDDIAISVVCLLAKHCKPMIDAGMVGRILPPAYSIPVGNGKKVYVRSQREFYDKILKQFIKNETVSYKGKELTKKELRVFVEKNFEYDTMLDMLAKRYCCEPKVMEYIAWMYHGDAADQKKSYWMTKMKPYSWAKILLEDGMVIIDGDIPGFDYLNLPFDKHFDKKVKAFKKLQAGNKSIDGYEINGQVGKTLYDVMHTMRSYIPKGVERFKGLGELDSKVMFDLCLNPKTRTVVIFKFKNYEDDMEKINVIMSTKQEYAKARADIIMSTTASPLDIDT